MASSSSSGSRKYDVFLSFRGEDTRKNYVDHLYKALSDQLIHTYKDDQTLPRGDSIGPSLLNAIEESQIAIIVFSKNYADSSWCLDELEYIMKCRVWRGLMVIPIFYNVSPSDVRKLQGNFGRAFVKRKRDNSTKEELWKKAIVEACNLSGWEPKNVANGHEAAGIKLIVDTVSKKLLSINSDVDENLVGMWTRLQTLKSLLDIGSVGVHMVGIWGVGGSGKTTLAYFAYQSFSQQFDGHCFINQIREKSTKDGLEKLQEKLLSTLLKTNVNVQSVEEGKDMIRRRLRRSNVLIVLDDVDQDDQVEALAGSHEWFGDGSRIIITTRDEHVLKRDKVKISHASLLSHDEAIQLFKRYAVQKDKPPIQDYDRLSLRVVSYANGLPLALKVLGSFLRGKDKKVWESVLEKMKNISNPTIMEKLKMSYDGLEPNERELFLDIACFHRGCRVDKAKEIFDACGFYPDTGIQVLIEKALITISTYGRFEMHDLVQEMGHYIVRGLHPKNPEKHSRVWKEEEILEMCSTDSAKENDKTEALRIFCSHKKVLSFGGKSVGFFKLVSNMKKLRLLIVLGSRLPDHDVEGPSFLSNELQYISYDNYPGSPFPVDFQPTKLVVLVLSRTLLKELWQDYKRLPQLKRLTIVDAKNLISTPDFDGFPCLEYLKLSGCMSLEEIHLSLGNCNTLVEVLVSECDKLITFPTIVSMKNLETLEIKLCRALVEFPEIHASMDSLKMLTLWNVGIQVLPASSIGHYCTKLTSLILNKCSNLKRIEGNFQALKHLEKLKIESYGWYKGKVEKLPNDLFSVCNLKRLNLSYCNFSRLPFSLLKLTRLRTLNLSHCKKLLEFPEFPSSVDLFVGSHCRSLESMGEFYKNCKRLSRVCLNDSNDVSGAQGLLQCMLHGKAINHHMNLEVDGLEIPKTFKPPVVRGSRCRLQLPHNWYNDFCGFLMCAVFTEFHNYNDTPRISLKHEQSNTMGMNLEAELWNECDDDVYVSTSVTYVSFDSLRHTTWWDTTSNAVSFSFKVNGEDVCSGVGVKLVARENESLITQTATDFSEFWDTYPFESWEDKDDYKFKFTIVDDTKSDLKIRYF